MFKFILSAAGALALVACGSGESSVDQLALDNGLRASLDEKALAEAVNQSIDREAVKDLARGAVAGAVQEAIPAEVRAVGAVIDEKALARGIEEAIDENALNEAVDVAVGSSGKSAGGE
jgi:hypothetical protein